MRTSLTSHDDFCGCRPVTPVVESSDSVRYRKRFVPPPLMGWDKRESQRPNLQLVFGSRISHAPWGQGWCHESSCSPRKNGAEPRSTMKSSTVCESQRALDGRVEKEKFQCTGITKAC